MTDKPVSILLMDDEIDSPVIQATIQHLINEGFDVDCVGTMSEAIESYYRRYYDVFILDIDMSHLADDVEGDGISVLKRFISLHNETKVIMYSAAGRSPHWFAAVNAHCFAYVHKAEDDALQNLTQFVLKSREALSGHVPAVQPDEAPKKILFYADNEKLKTEAFSVIKDSLGADWAVDFAETFENVSEKAGGGYGAVVVLKPEFRMRAEERKNMDRLLSVSPVPHVLIGCEAKDSFQSSILYMANRHPFRFVDISRDDWNQKLSEGLLAAEKWYGRKEIFKADADALKRLDIQLSDEILENWIDDEDLDEMYEEFYEDDSDAEGGK